jgi:hypothetical protein
VTFIDILFAFTAGKILDSLARAQHIPPEGWAHLGLAAVILLTSWVGYHASQNRTRYLIHFFNWPFWQFVLDVLMVVLYWLAALYIEGTGGLATSPTARPTTVIVALLFVLYVLWDLTARQMALSSQYDGGDTQTKRRRRLVTLWCCALALLIVGVVFVGHPTGGWVIVIAVGQILLLAGYRVLKEVVTPLPPVSNPQRSMRLSRKR